MAFASLAAVASIFAPDPARAAAQVYQYQIEHPSYGNIGTYSNTVVRDGDLIDVLTELHVAVKLIGIPLFHQDASRREVWQNGRFVAFQGTTDDNGSKIDLTGSARDDGFVIVSPGGTITAPPQVHPSNPWALSVLATNAMMSTKSGRVDKIVVTDTGETSVTFDGRTLPLHQYFVDSDKHEIVWFDAHGVPVAFQTSEKGALISFVLKGHGFFLP